MRLSSDEHDSTASDFNHWIAKKNTPCVTFNRLIDYLDEHHAAMPDLGPEANKNPAPLHMDRTTRCTRSQQCLFIYLKAPGARIPTYPLTLKSSTAAKHILYFVRLPSVNDDRTLVSVQ